jgi:LCP family protein required for cell wall assembly
MFRAHGGMAIAGKAGYAMSCVLATLVLVASGFTYYVKAQVSSIGGSSVISSAPSVGAMNILLMGLESRTYWSGKPLPRGLEDIMHIGHSGGNATNTLILIHIFAGGQKAIGFSIPRDNWVNMVGTNGYGGTQGKIDQAYGFAMANKENQLQGAKLSQGQLAFQGNEAGRLAEIQTVEALTGVHIDHFAELNLDGFYELAMVFGGAEVCLNHAISDTNSGFAGQKGYQHLDAAQTLAFVRQRDGLTNNDLDRTHRQQAVIDYVIWKLKHQGVLTDLSQLSSLLTVAKQYLITDSSWNLLDFLTEMKSLSGTNLTFQTLPVHGYATYTVGGQREDVNIVDPAAIKEIVHNAFYLPATSQKSTTKKSTGTSSKKSSPSLAPSATTVDVYNGGGTRLLATHLSQALTLAGFKAGKVGTITAQSSTQVLYGTGAAASAAKIAGYFNGVTATASSSVAAGHVEVLLGTYATSVPTTIVSSPASASSPSTSSSPTSPASSSAPTAAESNGASGGAVTVKANAPYGIPCVN